jgi:hypothetical protein
MAFLSRLKRALKAVAYAPAAPVATVLDVHLQLELSRELARLQSEVRRAMPENPAGWGYKVYSQADEDGILDVICNRQKLRSGVFVEIGCGDGRENNTHYLLLKGWRGVWIDGNAEHLTAIRAALPQSDRLGLIQAFVTRENVVDLLRPALATLGSIDVLSVDIDSNDLEVAQTAITAFQPKVVVGEYNAKFPYPLKLAVDYEPDRMWQGDDYQGASLAAWIEGLTPGYQLVSCNLAGTNAFFVRSDSLERYGSYSPAQLYQPARFYLTALQSGHRPSLTYLANLLRQSPASDSNAVN